MDKVDYFEARQVKTDSCKKFRLHAYFFKVLPKNKNTRILDIGCGFGQYLQALRKLGYEAIYGIDISKEAVAFCVKQKLNVELKSFINYFPEEKFDFVIMGHVLEHLEKDKIIPALIHLRKNILKRRGEVLIMVPNAQSNTGCYWAYEDFTHNYLFTSGSIYFVLKYAGFNNIKFMDIDCTTGLKWWERLIRGELLKIYRLNKNFWNLITSSSYHKPSPKIYSYEIKVRAKVD